MTTKPCHRIGFKNIQMGLIGIRTKHKAVYPFCSERYDTLVTGERCSKIFGHLSVLEHWVSSITNYQKFFIPYWDWTTNRTIPNWLENFKPQVNVPNTEKITPGPLLGKVSLFNEVLENLMTFLQKNKSMIVWRCHHIQNLLRLS